MATLLLQTAGAAIGGLFGPVGAVAGRAIGALAGRAIDEALLGSDDAASEASAEDLEVQGSREGTPVPRVYGRVQVTGQLIWATRLETDAAGGGKGLLSSGEDDGETAYYANFAVGLCEGPVARIARVWADGSLLDLGAVVCRFYLGDEAQGPDSLIEAKEGAGNAPAYRGLAYAVFERLPLAEFGNRIPQLSFEVIRPVPGLEQRIRAITVIPGATEFGYDPRPVSEVLGAGSRDTLNRHMTTAESDWTASLDELQALCPNLESVALVVTWFGDDLRAGACTVRPGVTASERTTTPEDWCVSGIERAEARLVTTHDGHAAYGGTPSDGGVLRAIADLKQRGLKVLFHPFLMMDVAAGNALPDPYGDTEQAAYPWRGRITASIAPGLPGSPDQTAAAADELAPFVGTAAPGDFTAGDSTVSYGGPAEWSFRRMVLHYAHLCAAAGGVDAFLIGSELRGLTTLRSAAASFPFVDALMALATDVRGILGGEVELSYAADWSEYFGCQPADGSGDVYFHLDPLWASSDIDFVGIDNYMPLADWRDGGDHLDAGAWHSGREAGYLRANVAGGEGFDWYYASDADRAAQLRTAITDGAHGKPWVFRYKDLAGWWGNSHYDRPGGVEAGAPTGWVPEGKPIRFTEFGCPAVDKGANQPNRFPDPKSAESGLPHFSSGGHDETIQRHALEAVLRWFDAADPDFEPAANPVSAVYGARMVDAAAIHLWSWDARPFPAFPLRSDRWADGDNWRTGHWLSGRLGTAPAAGLVEAVLADYGFADGVIGDLEGVVEGYLIDQTLSGREALEPLADLLFFEAAESGDELRFVRRAGRTDVDLDPEDLAVESDRPEISVRRAQETELPFEIAIGFFDLFADYRSATASARRLTGTSRRVGTVATGAVLRPDGALLIAEQKLHELWETRETVSFALPPRFAALEPGDICTLPIGGEARTLFVTRIEDAGLRRVEARRVAPEAIASVPTPAVSRPLPGPVAASPPDVTLLDLPLLDAGAPVVRAAIFVDPWPGPMTLALGTAATGFSVRQTVRRRATMGELLGPLWSGPTGRWDRVNSVDVMIRRGDLAAVAELAVLNGANLAAVGSEESGWELLHFADAELVAERVWRLSRFLRGIGGTEDMAALGHPAGASLILLDPAVTPLDLGQHEAGLALTLRCGPAGRPYEAERFTDRPVIAAQRGGLPLAPARVKGRRDPATGDWSLSWIRRTRTGGDSWEQVEVPLGEEAEAYELEVLDGEDGAVLRTISGLGSPACTYSAAMQTADFGSAQWDLWVRVYQLSATYGRGIAAEPYIWNFEADL